jgi:hypothetical protein
MDETGKFPAALSYADLSDTLLGRDTSDFLSKFVILPCGHTAFSNCEAQSNMTTQ